MGSSAGIRVSIASASALTDLGRAADTIAVAGLASDIIRALQTLHYHVQAVTEAGCPGGPHVLAAIIGDEIEDPAGVFAGLPAEVPKIWLTRDHSFEMRRSAARAGVEAVIRAPGSLPRILDWLDFIEARQRIRRPSVLLIEDDPGLAFDYGAALLRAGLDTEVACSPAAAIQALDQDWPDLIILDIQHPAPDGVADGFELAAMIGQTRECCDVPVVFLDSETALLASGAGLPPSRYPAPGRDHRLPRPDNAGDLVREILPRATRARAWRDLGERDAMTHLYHQRSFELRGAAELARSRRAGATCSLGLITIEPFLEINARFGRAAGDRVLKTLARLLRSRLRATDLTGRLGGGDFAVLFPATGAGCARSALRSLQADFAQIVFEEGSRCFTTSFRFEITGSPGLSWQKMWSGAHEALAAGSDPMR